MVGGPRISSTEDGSSPDWCNLSRGRIIAHIKKIASNNLHGVEYSHSSAIWEKTLRAPRKIDDFCLPRRESAPGLEIRRRLTISLAHYGLAVSVAPFSTRSPVQTPIFATFRQKTGNFPKNPPAHSLAPTSRTPAESPTTISPSNESIETG